MVGNVTYQQYIIYHSSLYKIIRANEMEPLFHDIGTLDTI